MPTRTYTVVLERADTPERQYIASVPCLDQSRQYFVSRGRTADEALKRVKETIITGLVGLSQEPDFKDYPLDRPKPRLVKVQIALPEIVNITDTLDKIIGPRTPRVDNVTPLKPRRPR